MKGERNANGGRPSPYLKI
jgi:hypothetical protein